MFNNLFSKDDPAALAYDAAHSNVVAYEDEAWKNEHKPILAKMISASFSASPVTATSANSMPGWPWVLFLASSHDFFKTTVKIS